MRMSAALAVGILMGILSCRAYAGAHAGADDRLIRLEDPQTLQAWRIDAHRGDAEKQERLAELFLGPHARTMAVRPYEGVHFLLRAAINGRRGSMLQLADALNKGAFGLKKLPEAAQCWSGTPADTERRFACLSLTDFQDPRARVPCAHLTLMSDRAYPGRNNGVAMARLCLANKTPALLVPGPPPGQQALERVRSYGKHGIEWVITGDVFEEDFEKFRYEFNNTMVAEIEAKRGRDYMTKLSQKIEAHISTLPEGFKRID